MIAVRGPISEWKAEGLGVGLGKGMLVQVGGLVVIEYENSAGDRSAEGDVELAALRPVVGSTARNAIGVRPLRQGSRAHTLSMAQMAQCQTRKALGL